MSKTRRSWLRRFWKGDGGLTAVEFALVAPVFLPLLTGMLETSLMYSMDSVLETATLEAARQVRTGQVQDASSPQTAFTQALCNRLQGYISCSGLYYDVSTFQNYSDIDLEFSRDASGNPTGTGFNPGGAGDIVAVRVAHRYQFYTPFMGSLFTDNDGNSRLLVATAVFRNEPFDD